MNSTIYEFSVIPVVAQAIFSFTCEIIFQIPFLFLEGAAIWHTGKASSVQPASGYFSRVTLTVKTHAVSCLR